MGLPQLPGESAGTQVLGPLYPWTLRVMGSDSILTTGNTRSGVPAGCPGNAQKGGKSRVNVYLVRGF